MAKSMKFVKGIFAIFGHGNVLGLGQALEQDSGDMRVYQGRNEQGMAHAATGFARQALRRQIIACTSSIGPGAANMITAAGTASANRIPLLLLPGDVFATRQPDPVLQQIEQSYDLSISTNDAFRAVSKYWDRITRPEQLMSACINAMRVLTDPAETGAVTLCLPQDVQGEAWDYPESFFARRVHRLDRRPASAAQLADAVAAIKASRKPLIVCGGGVKYSGAGEALSRFAERYGCPLPKPRPGRGRWSLLIPERRRRRRDGLPGGEPAGERGRPGDRRRHPFQRFYHRLEMDFPAPGGAFPEY
jgi:3D-(3,5/4)-trihydroxycyclohexane-1,2-dione acylhydrolase (decyclizing)